MIRDAAKPEWVHCSEEKIHFENKPKTGHTLIRLLCLDPDPVWAFASGMLTVLLTS